MNNISSLRSYFSSHKLPSQSYNAAQTKSNILDNAIQSVLGAKSPCDEGNALAALDLLTGSRIGSATLLNFVSRGGRLSDNLHPKITMRIRQLETRGEDVGVARDYKERTVRILYLPIIVTPIGGIPTAKYTKSETYNMDTGVFIPQKPPTKIQDLNYAAQIKQKVAQGYTRVWPVSGNGKTPDRNDIAPNGQTLANGNYSATGKEGFRSGRKHDGVDLAGSIGSPVYAAASGFVVEQRTMNGYGRSIVIDHQDGTRSLYAHLNSEIVFVGQKIKIGQIIGTLGIDGNKNSPGKQGSHLHFEITKTAGKIVGSSAQRIDPNIWISNGRP